MAEMLAKRARHEHGRCTRCIPPKRATETGRDIKIDGRPQQKGMIGLAIRTIHIRDGEI